MLVAQNLHKTYGERVAVHDFSVSVERGQIVGLLGPNGAGKSTTVALLCGLVAPDLGTVSVDGATLQGDVAPARRRIGVGLLLMRKPGLWRRLRATPLSRVTLIGARIASGTVIATLLMAGIYVAAAAFFGVRVLGSLVGFVTVVVSFTLMAPMMGLMIAAVGRTPDATRGLAIVVTLLLVMLGGAWIPTFLFPEWLASITRFIPTRWAIDGLDAMTWRAQGIDAVVIPVLAMLGCSALFAALAVRGFRWQED